MYFGRPIIRKTYAMARKEFCLITVFVYGWPAVPVLCGGHAGMMLKGIGKGMAITETEAESDGQNTSIGVVKFRFGTVHRFIDQILLEGYPCFLVE